MKKLKLLSFLLFVLTAQLAQAQKLQVQGQLYDSSSNTKIINAAVMLLQAKDSIIVAHTRTGTEGNFQFTNLDSGKYVMTFLYPGYVDLSKKVDVTQTDRNIGKINIFRKEVLLQEVVVKGRKPITIKGDTTEYDAGSFKVQPNANVEDLLKQLPSIQVDQNGNITAQGEKVKHVYVDGEEFFGDDPTLVTKNLRADIIDKVQVYDKKSEAAAFTGVDDGSREKTVNLVVKEDKKNGYFGKIDAGYGTDNFYSFQGLFNHFKGNRKISAFLTQSNTGVSGLNSTDQTKIGTGNGEYSEGNYNGKGLPSITNGGLHYDNKWKASKTELNANYAVNNVVIKGDDRTFSQNNLAEEAQYRNSENYFDNRSLNNTINAKVTQELDSTSKLIIYADGGLDHSNNYGTGRNSLRREDQTVLYNQSTSNRQQNDQLKGNLNIDWLKNFKKKGRSLAMYVHQNNSNNSGNALSLSTTDFLNPQSNTFDTQVLNLRKTQNSTVTQTTFNTYYTEPITDKWTAALSYQFITNGNKDRLLSYNDPGQNTNGALNDQFSTDFNTSQSKNQGGLSFLYNYKKLNFNFGANIADVNFSMRNLLQNNALLRRDFTTYNPVANLAYTVGTSRINFNYTGNTQLPGNTQLQPFLYNNSQVVTFNPNTNLETSYNNALSLNYNNNYNLLNFSYLGAGLNVNSTQNPIVLALDNDASGLYNYQYRNLNGYSNQSISSYVYWGSKIKKLSDMMLRGYLSGNFGKSYSMMNNQINRFDVDVYSFNIGVGKEVPEKIGFYVFNSLSYNSNVSSLQPALSSRFYSNTTSADLKVYFLKSFEWGTSLGYEWQQKSNILPQSFNRTIWNAYLGKNFGKKKDLLLKLSAHDLLNQNTGFSINANAGNISQNTFTTIRRYFMFSLVWNFNNFAGVKQ